MLTYIQQPHNSPAAGQICFDSNTNQMKIYDGSHWTVLSTQEASEYTMRTGYELFGHCGYWVSVVPIGPLDYRIDVNAAVHTWVEDTFGKCTESWGTGRWVGSNSRYYFREEKDRDWFILRWSS